MDTKTYLPKLAPVIAVIGAMVVNFWFDSAILTWRRCRLAPLMESILQGGPLIVGVVVAFVLYAFPRPGKWVVNKWVFGFGVRLKHLVVTILLVIFGFSGLFYLADLEKLIIKCEPRPFGWDYFNGLYFSVITFATVGYGDLRAVGWAAGLAMVEGLLGIALNAALVVVIFRKLIR